MYIRCMVIHSGKVSGLNLFQMGTVCVAQCRKISKRNLIQMGPERDKQYRYCMIINLTWSRCVQSVARNAARLLGPGMAALPGPPPLLPPGPLAPPLPALLASSAVADIFLTRNQSGQATNA
jgi:hypothetical protein